MRLFLDTEFNGFRGELISIGIAPESGSIDDYYAEVKLPDDFKFDPWVEENVVPHLNRGGVFKETRENLRSQVMDYIRHFPRPEIVVDWASDPWYLFDIILGDRHDPKGFIDMTVNFYRARNSVPSRVPHHAMEDARAARTSYMIDHIK